MPTCVLITCARNEEIHIGLLLECVLAQTVTPRKWIIASDGSTDRTDDIVREYAGRHPWIELLCVPERGPRDFASKVYAFNAAYDRIRSLDFDIIGNLDADLTFGNDYLEYLLRQFSQCQQLGVAGTPFVEDSSIVYNYQFTNIEHVSGGCQLFRRACFEAVGGFPPIKGGGEDWVAVTTARMRGWRTRTFTERHFVHHRKMGQAATTMLRARLNDGRNDYLFGNHPLWELSRALYQLQKRPYLIGSFMLLYGYLKPLALGEPRPIAAELMAFTRREQLQRLKSTFGKLLAFFWDKKRRSPHVLPPVAISP
jgi:glycosyltransferase involved in cell wall biosynthesis